MPTSLIVATCASGKITMGSSAVAASGIASVIHQAPMSTVTAAVTRSAWWVYSVSGSAPTDS